MSAQENPASRNPGEQTQDKYGDETSESVFDALRAVRKACAEEYHLETDAADDCAIDVLYRSDVEKMLDRVEQAAWRERGIRVMAAEANERLREHLDIALACSGNIAEMRDALKRIRPNVAALTSTPFVEDRMANGYEALAIIDAALRKPARICDKYPDRHKAIYDCRTYLRRHGVRITPKYDEGICQTIYWLYDETTRAEVYYKTADAEKKGNETK